MCVNNGRYRGHWESECSPAFWAGHCAVHGYSPVVGVAFLNNRRRHHEVISLLTTTVLMSLSLRSLVCYQTNSTDNRLLAGRASIFLTFAARSTIIYFGKDQGNCEWLRRLGNVSGWRTSFRRTIFVIQTKVLYCAPTITHRVSFWRLKCSQLLRKFVSQNKAKNAGRSRKNAGMREIHQNARFPARLRDG